ncbi:MAG: T9SS type A sorting domain-containing protein [Saprospiraceae bacterium]|nr:T9SS type A sorting domain-containing protein [Saprospiraceae bacterium]
MSPNPVSDILRIQENIDLSGEIIDVFGKKVKTFVGTQSGIDVHDLPPGTYFIKSRNRNNILAQFIKL